MGKPIEIEVDNIKYPSQSAFCKAFGLDYRLFKTRKSRGWSIKEQIQGYKDDESDNEKCNSKQERVYNRIYYDNKIINNAHELIEAIELYPDIKTINLIDYENISDNKLLINNHINDKNIINIFFYNACIYSNNYYNLTKDSKSINFQILSKEAADQLIDHMLIFYLSVINYKFPDKKIKIFSNDSGFYPFIKSLKSNNIKIAELRKSIKRGYKYSLAEYILNHAEITESKYFYKSDFKKLFIDFYKDKNKRLNKNSINNLISELHRFNFIDSIELSEIKQYRFCIKEILKYKKDMSRE